MRNIFLISFSRLKLSQWTLSLAFLLTVFVTTAQQRFSLGSVPFTIQNQQYNLKEIQDARTSRQEGKVYVSGRNQVLTLQGGVAGIAAIVPKIKDKRNDIVLIIKSINFQETSGGNLVKGKMLLQMVFSRSVEDTLLPLTTYEASTNYTRSVGLPADYSAMLRSGLQTHLAGFNLWMISNGQKHPHLANGVRVVLKPYRPRFPSQDTVYYAQRPVVWSDFIGPVRRNNTSYGAAIFSSFGYDAHATAQNGEIVLEVFTKVFMLKNSSWKTPEATTPYALAHEQLHFDITQLIALRFGQRLQQEQHSVIDYDSRMQYLFVEAFQELNKLQNQYDDETRHSLDTVAQARWADKIRKELSGFK